MTDIGTSRRYRPDPSRIGRPETWGRGSANASLTSNCVIIAVEGELDASNTPQLCSYIERHQFIADRLYLDLRQVTFCATAGLAVLYRVKHQRDEQGAYWRMLTGPAVRKLLRVCNAGGLPQLDNLNGVLGRPELGRTPLAAAGR
jgi:anti-anti-sigma factor